MKYQDPACAYCPPDVRACRVGESAERGPGFCPTKVDGELQESARALYDDPEVRQISREAAIVESEGYCKWTRVEEIVQFSKRMAYKKIGIANCISFVDHAYVLTGILESHGFEVVSVACKNGSIPKEEIGLTEQQKREAISPERTSATEKIHTCADQSEVFQLIPHVFPPEFTPAERPAKRPAKRTVRNGFRSHDLVRVRHTLYH